MMKYSGIKRDGEKGEGRERERERESLDIEENDVYMLYFFLINYYCPKFNLFVFIHPQIFMCDVFRLLWSLYYFDRL